MNLGESKSQYVSRKVNAYRKEESRLHESEGTTPDPEDTRAEELEVKWAAEDWWDFTHGDSIWPW
jgi:hypothetical protein